MKISAKVSNSLFKFLEHHQIEWNELDTYQEFPFEKAKNPEAWIEARELEDFLGAFSKWHGKEDIIYDVALKSVELRAWGILDSVLKLVQDPKDLFSTPERLLAYFIHPEPVVTSSVDGSQFRLEMPFDSAEWPYFSLYLKGVFETLPCFSQQPAAGVTWQGCQLIVNLSSSQENLLASVEPHQFKPDFVAKLLEAVDVSQRRIESLNGRLAEKEKEINFLKTSLAASAEPLRNKFQQELEETYQDMSRLGDYFSRAHQLITLFSSNPEFKAILKKTNWDSVALQYPELIEKLKVRTEFLQKGELIPESKEDKEAASESQKPPLFQLIKKQMDSL